ncbi:MAG TPA: DUF3137 domain-containing protein [Sedimentisphaerales bacterium]|nr:DUF3137 domain-containing protein [Sedimentisphaerales bacterium]
MRTLEELRTFYDKTLVKDLSALEQERRKRLRMVGIGLAAAVFILVVSLLITVAMGLPPIAIFGLILAIIVFAVVSSIGSKDYVSSFKSTVIRPLVRFFDPALRYSPSECVPQETFILSRMFDRKPDRYKGDDLVSGRAGATEIAFSEVHAEYRTVSTSGKGRPREQWHTIFKGLLFIGDFNKHFHGATVVSPDIAQRLFGRLGQKLQGITFFSDLKLVKLEDPQFEKLFVVHSNDQIEARYILSTSLMERIVQFRNKTGKNISMSFVGSRVFVAIPHVRNLFEPKMFQSLLDFDTVSEYFQDINLAVGIVEDLNLNTRIWSKE